MQKVIRITISVIGISLLLLGPLLTQSQFPQAQATQNDDLNNLQQQSKDPHAAGTTLGSYIFGRNLGKGTFGKVKLATHL